MSCLYNIIMEQSVLLPEAVDLHTVLLLHYIQEQCMCKVTAARIEDRGPYVDDCVGK